MPISARVHCIFAGFCHYVRDVQTDAQSELDRRLNEDAGQNRSSCFLSYSDINCSRRPVDNHLLRADGDVHWLLVAADCHAWRFVIDRPLHTTGPAPDWTAAATGSLLMTLTSPRICRQRATPAALLGRNRQNSTYDLNRQASALMIRAATTCAAQRVSSTNQTQLRCLDRRVGRRNVRSRIMAEVSTMR